MPVGSAGRSRPTARRIYLTAEDAGHEKRLCGSGGWRFSEAGRGRAAGRVHALRHCAASVDAVLVRELGKRDPVRPKSSASIRRRSNRTFLTSFTTKSAASIDWLPLREFWFTGRRRPTHPQLVALPPQFDESKKYPLFVLIHGGSRQLWRDSISYRWNYHLLAHPGFVVLLTDYRGSTGYGEKFTLDIQGDPLAGPADDINDAADEAIKRFSFIDGTRQAAAGASYGGHLPTGWRARRRATGASSATPAWPRSRCSGVSATASTTAS